MSNLDFENVNLSQEPLPENTNIYMANCNFKNTNLPFNINRIRLCRVLDSNFSGIDLSPYRVSDQIFIVYRTNLFFGNTNLSNTGLSIKISNAQDAKMRLKEYLKKGKLNGCYVNERLIHTREELQALKEKNIITYRDEIILNHFAKDIDRQISMQPKSNK